MQCIYIWNKEKRREQGPKLHVDGKIIVKCHIWAVQQDDAFTDVLVKIYFIFILSMAMKFGLKQ
jgi:hypothetical protein